MQVNYNQKAWCVAQLRPKVAKSSSKDNSTAVLCDGLLEAAWVANPSVNSQPGVQLTGQQGIKG